MDTDHEYQFSACIPKCPSIFLNKEPSLGNMLSYTAITSEIEIGHT